MYYRRYEIIEVLEKAVLSGFIVEEYDGDKYISIAPNKIQDFNRCRLMLKNNNDTFMCNINTARYYRRKSCPDGTYMFHYNYNDRDKDDILLLMKQDYYMKVFQNKRTELVGKNKQLIIEKLKRTLDEDEYIMRFDYEFKGNSYGYSRASMSTNNKEFSRNVYLLASDDIIIRTCEADGLNGGKNGGQTGGNSFRYRVNVYENIDTKELMFNHRLHFSEMETIDENVLDIDITKINDVLKACIDINDKYKSLSIFKRK